MEVAEVSPSLGVLRRVLRIQPGKGQVVHEEDHAGAYPRQAAAAAVWRRPRETTDRETDERLEPVDRERAAARVHGVRHRVREV